MVNRSVHRLSRILLTCLAQDHFGLLTCSITSVTLAVSFTQIFVFLSRYVMFNILLSNYVFAPGRLFMFRRECPCFRAVCHCWKYAWVVDFSFQACSNATIEDVAVHGKCCPSGREPLNTTLATMFRVPFLTQLSN